MNLIQALKTGKPLRRPIAKHLGSSGDGWLGNEWVKSLLLPPKTSAYLGAPIDRFLSDEDIMADDWEVPPDTGIVIGPNPISIHVCSKLPKRDDWYVSNTGDRCVYCNDLFSTADKKQD